MVGTYLQTFIFKLIVLAFIVNTLRFSSQGYIELNRKRYSLMHMMNSKIGPYIRYMHNYFIFGEGIGT